MKTTLGRPDSQAPVVAVPPAARAQRPGWRDPRLWAGIVLVALSVVAGARLLAAADTSVQVWAVRDDLAVGDTVTADDLVAQRVRFVTASDSGRYLLAADELPADLTLLRDVGAGELLPRSALGAAEESGIVQVPFVLAAQKVPSGVAPGSRVSLYVSVDGKRRAQRILSDVVVVDAPQVSTDFGPGTERQLVLGVEAGGEPALAAAIAAADQGDVTVVSQG